MQPNFMSERVARQVALRMRQHLRSHNKLSASIVFHGGEPLLGGLGHLQSLTSIIEDEFKGSGIQLSVGMQSNGLLLDPEIAEHLLKWGMSIGISIDGPPDVNDIFRLDHKGIPSSSQLEERLSLLTSQRFRPIFSGFLSVINISVDPGYVLKYLLSFDPPSIDFLFPLKNHHSKPIGKESSWELKPYGDWLKLCFDYWIKSGVKTKVRVFNSIIGQIVGASSLIESIGTDVVDLIVVEANGDLEGVDSLKSTYEGASELGYNVFEHDFDSVAKI